MALGWRQDAIPERFWDENASFFGETLAVIARGRTRSAMIEWEVRKASRRLSSDVLCPGASRLRTLLKPLWTT